MVAPWKCEYRKRFGMSTALSLQSRHVFQGPRVKKGYENTALHAYPKCPTEGVLGGPRVPFWMDFGAIWGGFWRVFLRISGGMREDAVG